MGKPGAIMLLGVVGLAFLNGATPQTCTNATGSKAVAVTASWLHTCALLVSKRGRGAGKKGGKLENVPPPLVSRMLRSSRC